MDAKPYRIENDQAFKLTDFKTRDKGGLSKGPDVREMLKGNIRQLAALQNKLYAHNKYGVLIILQAMDAAGKDSAIKHICSGLNPQGVVVTPFKQPSTEELDHDFLWRSHQHLPERGNIAIFNRSYYEDVLVVKVHDLLLDQNMPAELVDKHVWENRYRQIRDYELYMHENGIQVIKFFLHISKDKQAKRFLDRIDNPDKNWKFSAADLRERQFWGQYQQAYEEMIRQTATRHAPWYIIPSDHKWYARLLISDIIVRQIGYLPLEYPNLSDQEKSKLKDYRLQLEGELQDERPDS